MSVLGGDTMEQLGDRVVVAVIAGDRDARATERVDLGRGGADRARERVIGLAHRSARHIDDRARGAELERAALADPPAPAGDDCNPPNECAHAVASLSQTPSRCSTASGPTVASGPRPTS